MHLTATPTRLRLPREQRLRRFLNAYWLRPENALWMALRSETLDRCKLTPEAADISCGDGVFSFLHAGGTFLAAFDVFQSARQLDHSADPSADMFDHVAGDYAPPILHRPSFRFAVGLDLKPALLAKAAALDFYDSTMLHDNETPLPLPDAAFKSVYCNSAYWVRSIDAFLHELARICAPTGRVILHVKLRCIHDYTLRSYEPLLGQRFMKKIDRGRAASWPTLADRDEWLARFASAGLAVEGETPFVTRTHAHIWDVGLRPIAPLLVRMANALTPETRASIKAEWVDLLTELLLPLCDPDLDLCSGRAEPAEVQFELSPNP